MQEIKRIDYSFPNGDKIFFSSDLHWFHKSIMEFCKRPFQDLFYMNEALIDNWNATVPKDGIVFCLGDFIFGNQVQFLEIISRLNGKIYLCIGNHDKQSLKTANSIFFEDVSYQYYIKVGTQKIWLSHFPYLCFPHSFGDIGLDWALSGHTHVMKRGNTGADTERFKFYQPSQYDVGVDFNDYRPVSFAEVKEKIDYQVTHNVNLTHWIEDF